MPNSIGSGGKSSWNHWCRRQCLCLTPEPPSAQGKVSNEGLKIATRWCGMVNNSHLSGWWRLVYPDEPWDDEEKLTAFHAWNWVWELVLLVDQLSQVLAHLVGGLEHELYFPINIGLLANHPNKPPTSHGLVWKYSWLVVWLPLFIFPLILGCIHHPNWRTHIFQDGVGIQPPTRSCLQFGMVSQPFSQARRAGLAAHKMFRQTARHVWGSGIFRWLTSPVVVTFYGYETR